MAAKTRIGIVTAFWGRHALTEFVFRNIMKLACRLAPEMELVPAASGSEGGSSRMLAENCGFLYAEAPNQPLGAKWNAALELLAGQNLDGVCILGSDDLVNEAYFRELSAAVRRGSRLVGLKGLYFFDHPTGRLLYWKGYPPPDQNLTPGAGRFIHAEILERLGWKLWPDDIYAGLDRAMGRKLGTELGCQCCFDLLPCADSGAVITDIKGHGGMNSFEVMAVCGDCILAGKPKDFFVRNYSPETARELYAPGIPDIDCDDCSLSVTCRYSKIQMKVSRFYKIIQ